MRRTGVKMSFAKASVKRFNEELNDAPAPNAYDAKMPQKKISAVDLAKDNLPRFQEPKVLSLMDFDAKICILTHLSRMLALAQASTWRTHLTHWGPSPRVAGCYALHHSGCFQHHYQFITLQHFQEQESDGLKD